MWRDTPYLSVFTLNAGNYGPEYEYGHFSRNDPFIIGLSRSKIAAFICFNKNPLKVMKNGFYFMLKSLFVLEIFLS